MPSVFAAQSNERSRRSHETEVGHVYYSADGRRRGSRLSPTMAAARRVMASLLATYLYGHEGG